MSSSLSIYLDQTSLALKDTSGYTNLSGCIHLENADTLPTWARIQFLGQEKIDTASRIIVDDTYQLSSRPNDWQQDPENKRHFTLLFSFSIPQDMPTSVHICKYHSEDEEETEGGIYYTLEATVSTLKQKSIVPIIIYRPYCSLSVPRRLCWGITGHSNMWQYEIDVPHIMDTCTESGSINLRLRSIQNKSKRVAETCLIGCQLIQVVQLEGHEIQYQVLTTTTQLLTSPNSTWTKPCQVDFEVYSQPLPSVSSELLNVDHYLKLTMSFCDITGKAYRSIDSEFPVTITGCCPSPEGALDVMFPRSQSVCSMEVASHDSAVDIQSSEPLKDICSH